MWRMTSGDGVLAGAQARLVKLAIAKYAEWLDESDAWDDDDDGWVRVEQVSRMERRQMLHMLATVARALLKPDVPQPLATADSEAMAYQIFMFLSAAAGAEIDMFDELRTGTETRRAISDALLEAGYCKNADERCGRCAWCCPDPGSSDLDEWDEALEALADQVLWDRDWEMETLLADAEPDKADSVKGAMAIDSGYFSSLTPEPTEAEAAAARAYLESVRAEVLGV